MKITRNVIIDLLPLYLADEVSDETRDIVEQFLAQDPSLQKLIARLEQAELPDIPAPSNKELEMKSLEKTKRILRQQRLLLSMSIGLTALLFTIRGGSEGIRWAWAETPIVGWILLVTATMFWIAYANVVWQFRDEEG